MDTDRSYEKLVQDETLIKRRPWYVQVEEECESLDSRSLLFGRWRAWWQRLKRGKWATPALDALDPHSVCARYRELLHAVAAEKSALARQASETPAEYETRLLPHLAAPNASSQDGAEALILDELTQACLLERYGSICAG